MYELPFFQQVLQRRFLTNSEQLSFCTSAPKVRIFKILLWRIWEGKFANKDETTILYPTLLQRKLHRIRAVGGFSIVGLVWGGSKKNPYPDNHILSQLSTSRHRQFYSMTYLHTYNSIILPSTLLPMYFLGYSGVVQPISTNSRSIYLSYYPIPYPY